MPASIIVTEQIGLGFGGIAAPEMTQDQAEAEAREVATFRKNIDWRNPAVCIDGRTVFLLEGQEPLPLGAHIAGAIETPLVAAKAVGYHLEGEELVDSLKSKGFTLGAHVDTGNRDQEFANGTGCGACDKCDGNCGLFAKYKTELEATVSTLLGDDFNKTSYDKLVLSTVSDDKDHARNLAGEENTETLTDDGEGVHGHRESMVIFNYEENTTIDRDAYFAETGKQVFVVDVWYLKKLADAMATGTNAESQSKDLYQAMVAFQVATYIGLCDGSHRAAVFSAN